MSAVVQERVPAIGFRAMREADLSAVMAVEALAYPFPWTEGVFRDCLRAGYRCLLALQQTAVIGYGVMSIAAGECHILNLCVHPDWQGRRLGRKLLLRLLALARGQDADTVFLEVRVSNRPALRLYASEGFCEVGLRRGYYPAAKGREDAVILARAI